MHDHESIILQPSEDSNVGDIRAGRPCREKKKEKNVNMRHKQTERGTKIKIESRHTGRAKSCKTNQSHLHGSCK